MQLREKDKAMTNQSSILPFGKHKGRSIEEIFLDDPQYLQWLVGQTWFRVKFAVLDQVIRATADRHIVFLTGVEAQAEG